MLIERTPPNSKEAEEAFLSSLLIGSERAGALLDSIKPDMFYYPAHQRVMQAIVNIHNNKAPIDITTVTNELRRMGDPSTIAVYVMELASVVVSDINAEHYGQIIIEKFINREAIRYSQEIEQSAYDDNVEDVIVKAAAMENALLNNLCTVNGIDATEVFKINTNEIEERIKDGVIRYFDCGISAIDHVIGGFEIGNLVVIAGRPAMGKTAFALQLAYNMSYQYPTLFFTLEMTKEEIGMRFIVMLTDIDGIRLKRSTEFSDAEWRLIEGAGGHLDARKLIIDDSPHLSIYNLRSKIYRMVRTRGVKVVFIDYLQLMEGAKNKDGAEYYGTISRTCKQVAKELKITIFLLSQLNRDVEKRGEKIPRLYDLRASGEIEQDADVVIFPVRCKHAGIPPDPQKNIDDGKAIIAIAKNRHGAVSNPVICVSPNATRWWDMNDEFAGPTHPAMPSFLEKDKDE